MNPDPTPPLGQTPHPRVPALQPDVLDIAHAARVQAALRADAQREAQQGRARRPWLPAALFLATCLSTFWVGCTQWRPQDYLHTLPSMWAPVQNHWDIGLTYMAALLGILLAHEMGHFLMTLRLGIPASLPMFIPVPINAIGTMGAVIAMDGRRADRVQTFDIGVAGPLAGLVVAFPLLWMGVKQLNLGGDPLPGEVQLYNPLVVRWMIERLHPGLAEPCYWVGVSQVNALFMAGWVGMLITGLNMLPVSQLDGGHTVHGLFGTQSKTITEAFTVVAIAFVVIHLEQAAIWSPMLILVILMGIHHPPTADDSIDIGDTRWMLGMASMAIPILCFPLYGMRT